MQSLQALMQGRSLLPENIVGAVPDLVFCAYIHAGARDIGRGTADSIQPLHKLHFREHAVATGLGSLGELQRNVAGAVRGYGLLGGYYLGSVSPFPRRRRTVVATFHLSVFGRQLGFRSQYLPTVG